MLNEVDLTSMSQPSQTLLDIRAVQIDFLGGERQAIWSKESLIVDLDLPLRLIFALVLVLLRILIHQRFTVVIRCEAQVGPFICRLIFMIVIASWGFALIGSLERRVSISKLTVALS